MKTALLAAFNRRRFYRWWRACFQVPGVGFGQPTDNNRPEEAMRIIAIGSLSRIFCSSDYKEESTFVGAADLSQVKTPDYGLHGGSKDPLSRASRLCIEKTCLR